MTRSWDWNRNRIQIKCRSRNRLQIFRFRNPGSWSSVSRICFAQGFAHFNDAFLIDYISEMVQETKIALPLLYLVITWAALLIVGGGNMKGLCN